MSWEAADLNFRVLRMPEASAVLATGTEIGVGAHPPYLLTSEGAPQSFGILGALCSSTPLVLRPQTSETQYQQ